MLIIRHPWIFLVFVWFGLGLSDGLSLAQPVARWIGQDGHDFVSHSAQPGKSGIQDLHFTLSGLPPRLKIASAIVAGEGNGEWKFNGPPNSMLALIVLRTGGTVADLYVEPYRVENGRGFDFHLTFENGRKATFSCRGGKADPNLRMPGTGAEARWIGQDRQDRGGPSPNVGPDGFQDVHVALSKLAAKDEIRAILITGPGDLRWQFGPNHEAHFGIDLVRNSNDPTKADLYFQPIQDLAGKSLKIHMTYEKGATDTTTITGGKTDPALKSPPPLAPKLTAIAIKSTWLGQTRSGDVHVVLDSLPASGRLVSASLSDGIVGGWSSPSAEAGLLPLTIRPGADASKLELTFPPVRDETGATLTVRLVYADGRSVIGSFAGGACDPSLRAPLPEASTVQAKPGDDLNDLANRFGTVTLGPGTYPMNRPLVLNRPVTITSSGGATLLYSQPASDPPWTSAIKIHAGRTTLDRLAIRFASPVRWDKEVSYGPAVIGTTENREKPTGNILAGLNFTRLDVEGPPPLTGWEDAAGLLRLVGATNGVIESNRFKGGTIEMFGGPWRYVDNRHDGTHAGSFSHGVTAIHSPHDVLMARNQIKPLDPAGKSWRWLVLTHRGANVHVVDNTVTNVGPRDNDTHEHPNAPETILTESYRLSFEGKTSGTWLYGRVIAVPYTQGEPATVGSIVSILSGPQAGEWRRVVFLLSPTSFLLDRPVALGGGAISIGLGFVDTSFENNTIDARGSKIANLFVLGGQHFGTVINRNHTYGGGKALRLEATGSEAPVHWGWSHNPMFGLIIDGNTFEDAWEGSFISVLHGLPIRASKGRVYMTATLTNNRFISSDSFLSAQAQASRGKAKEPRFALILGSKPPGDPGDFLVKETGNQLLESQAKAAMFVHSATINGKVVKEASIKFASDHNSASPLSSTVR